MTEAVSHIAAKKIGEKAFTALPHVKISQDERNCLVINAPDVVSHKIVTNDLVELLSGNQFIFLGRMDNLVNSGGIKLIPEQIEAKLHASIPQRFFAIGVSDADLGEKLILVIEGEKYDFDKTLFDVLSKYEKPKDIIFVSKFKETPNGKVIRRGSLED